MEAGLDEVDDLLDGLGVGQRYLIFLFEVEGGESEAQTQPHLLL